MSTKPAATPVGSHGSSSLPLVEVESYNLEIEDEDGFIGDRASKGAFVEIVDGLRNAMRKVGDDPLGEASTDEIGRKGLDKLLIEGDAAATALVLGAVEEFAQRLTSVIRRFMRLKAWRDVERVVIGGGFRRSRIGEIAIARAEIMLKEQDVAVDLVPIRNHPNEAGLIGSVQLAPTWMFKGHNGIVAADIGGSNFRCGIIELGSAKTKNLAGAKVWKSLLWRHADEEPTREEAIDRLAGMLAELVAAAGTSKLRLAPFIGIGCPGLIAADGFIERGAQNLPGNWESSRFHLAESIKEKLPEIGGEETVVLMHNDAVVQGLSEAPFMRDVDKWGVLTIGTGLGNASFSNRRD